MDIASASVDRVFDYRVPSAMKEPGWRVRVPFGPRQIEGYVIALSETTELAEDKVRDIAAVLDSAPALLPEMIELARWMKGQYHCRLVDALRLMIPAQMRGGRVREKTVRMARLSVPKEAALAEAERLSRRAPVQAAILRTLAEGEKALTALAEMYTSANSAARSLSSKGLLIFEDKAIRRMPYQSLMGDGGEALALLPGQRAAADRIAEALRGTPGKPFLIRGITGSGKTEVYFESIAETLELGRSAIVLVPEISLTPQMVQRFTRRFGPLCAVLHSRLSVGERYDEWQRIRAGEARVVIGARSAVFAPAERLGLIVVDEEHELSYRSETQVRYDAVEVAEKRCAMAGAVLVMGSATPSIARFHEAESGKYRLITLESRAMGELPEVTVVDMCQELLGGNRSIFSRTLYRRLKDCLDRKEQAILFLNRRGYFTFVSCRECGHVMQCEHCDVSLTYHMSERKLKCHYCGYETELPKTCPECGSPYIRHFGSGTQKVEEEVHKLFPDARILRMDADTTAGKEGHLKILSAFEKGEADVLIGTQMVAKGLDFPRVTLVGVVAADATLFYPDFRSGERTFQILTQVAGRSGRGERKGSVVVQSYQPGHPSVRYAKNHDYLGFYGWEIGQRELGQYPPFGMFVRFVYTGTDGAALARHTETLKAAFDGYFETHDRPLLLTARPCPRERIKEKYRYEVLLKLALPLEGDILEDLYHIYEQNRAAEEFSVMEVDPVSML